MRVGISAFSFVVNLGQATKAFVIVVGDIFVNMLPSICFILLTVALGWIPVIGQLHTQLTLH